MAIQIDPSTTPHTEVTFPVTGMTCASCVRRMEKALHRVEDVQDASVNLATERAKVVFEPAHVTINQMRAAVQKAGYSIGELPQAAAAHVVSSVESSEPGEDSHDLEHQRELEDLKRKWIVSLVAGIAMMALMYLPLNDPMDVLAPVLLIVATAVQFWAGASIYQAAWTSARHGATNMYTLVAVGTPPPRGRSEARAALRRGGSGRIRPGRLTARVAALRTARHGLILGQQHPGRCIAIAWELVKAKRSKSSG